MPRERNVPRDGLRRIRAGIASKVLALALFSGLAGTASAKDASSSPPAAHKPHQFIALSFDGSSSIPVWKATLSFAERVPVRFTYFVSCTHFLLPKKARQYRPPRRRAGVTHVGWAKDEQDLAERLQQVNRALDNGHEIGSHACGHFDGQRWRIDHWRQEFDQFERILKGAYTLNGLPGEPENWQQRISDTVKGFRAPLLAINDNMFKVLAERGFRYDASEGAYMRTHPVKGNYGVWKFKLAFIPEGSSRRLTLAMDYNLMLRQTGKSSPSNHQVAYRRTLEAFMRYFHRNYNGTRAPMHIGLHFSRWNGGGYHAAMYEFAQSVCTKPDVTCGTYTQLANWLETGQLEDPVKDSEQHDDEVEVGGASGGTSNGAGAHASARDFVD